MAASGASRFPSEDEMVDMSIDEFSKFLETLSVPDSKKVRYIRRRGKNRVAARVCLKRKIDFVSDIEEDIESLRKKKEEIIKQRQKLLAENAYYKKKVDELQEHLFQSLQDESGHPLSSAGASQFPASEDEIFDMSISEFSNFLETLSEPEAQKAREIRRRGKNKVAARLCHERESDAVSDIDGEIASLRKKKEEIIAISLVKHVKLEVKQETEKDDEELFDLHSLVVDLDNLPLDIFNQKSVGQQAMENKHDSLLPLDQEPVTVSSEATATRNDSGFPSTESLLPQATRDWQSHSFPLLTSANIKQEKPEVVSVPSVPCPASTSTRFTPSTAPKDFGGACPTITAAGASHFPASEGEIVDTSIGEFSNILETLSESDAEKARDIRRKGKNKVAARLCRRRKIDVVSDIEGDIESLRKKKEEIIKQRQKLEAENAHYKKKVNELQEHLFQSLRDESGCPLSSKEYTIFQGANDIIYVGKNIDSESKKKQNSHSSD